MIRKDSASYAQMSPYAISHSLLVALAILFKLEHILGIDVVGNNGFPLDIAPLKTFYTHGILSMFARDAVSQRIYFHHSPSLFYFILKWTVGDGKAHPFS